jgi:CxxC motif-containing protein
VSTELVFRAGRAELVCIACPIGCRLTVITEPEVTVTGNRCPRGDTYGREEVLAPRRIVTAVVPTRSAAFPCAPVRTDRPLARELITQLLKTLYARTVSLPVRQGEALMNDFHGVRVIFTRTLPPDEVPPVGEPGPKPESEEEITLLDQAP